MAEMQVSPPFFDRATQGSECKLTEFSYAFVDDDSLGETATSLTRNGRPRDRQSALFVATGEGVAGDGAVDAVRRRAQDAGRVALGGPDQQRTDRSKRAIRERYCGSVGSSDDSGHRCLRHPKSHARRCIRTANEANEAADGGNDPAEKRPSSQAIHFRDLWVNTTLGNESEFY
jgi:hypothetical protein